MNIYPLFSVVGVEIEYMLVDASTLDIKPNADEILQALAGECADDYDYEHIGVSNELVKHVLELKMVKPAALTKATHEQFHQIIIQHIQPELESRETLLLPSAVHPWLTPSDNRIALWPYGNKEIYQAYDKIFGCHGHGFSNLQSIHLNLPFASDEEFTQLHSAIRVVLPLIPALCASSPLIEGKRTAYSDNRLCFYKSNQKRLPIIAGDVIPEFVPSLPAYHSQILQPIYEALKPEDPKGILQHEWVNSRGAIARFERDAIEIRLMDSQECPLADLTCVAIINGILQYLVAQTDCYITTPGETSLLKEMLNRAIQDGMAARCDDKVFLQQFGLQRFGGKNFQQLLSKLVEKAQAYIDPFYLKSAEVLLEDGNLSSRILKAVGSQGSIDNIRAVYRDLAMACRHNEYFRL